METTCVERKYTKYGGNRANSLNPTKMLKINLVFNTLTRAPVRGVASLSDGEDIATARRLGQASQFGNSVSLLPLPSGPARACYRGAWARTKSTSHDKVSGVWSLVQPDRPVSFGPSLGVNSSTMKTHCAAHRFAIRYAPRMSRLLWAW